jgi:hypothetical protein
MCVFYSLLRLHSGSRLTFYNCKYYKYFLNRLQNSSTGTIASETTLFTMEHKKKNASGKRSVFWNDEWFSVFVVLYLFFFSSTGIPKDKQALLIYR